MYKPRSRLAELRTLGIGPLAPMFALFKNWNLLKRVTTQELATRYRESFLGPFWALLVPLAQLAVFTFIFGSVLKSRWPGVNHATLDFPLNLFCGIIIYTMLAETLTRSATIMVDNVTYIKRVVFPVEILPVSAVVVSAVNFLAAFILLVIFFAFSRLEIPLVAILMMPVILAPFFVMLAGLAWLIAATGVYLRDIRHAIGPVMSLMMFLSPVLFPIASIPEQYRIFIYLNPVAVPVEQMRLVLMQGGWPDFYVVGIYALISWVIAWGGHAWFSILRRGFADVV